MGNGDGGVVADGNGGTGGCWFLAVFGGCNRADEKPPIRTDSGGIGVIASHPSTVKAETS